MNIIEAIKTAEQTDKWFRPISWSKTGSAFTIGRSKEILFVPTNRGGTRASFPDLDDMIGEWEAVEPKDVNNENNV